MNLILTLTLTLRANMDGTVPTLCFPGT